jgi:hypothetical protein
MAVTINGGTGITNFGGGTVVDTDDFADQAQAEAGSSNVTLMTPLRTFQAIDEKLIDNWWAFVGGEEVVSAASLLDVPHTLGRRPTEVEVHLKCTTAQSPYVLNEEVLVTSTTSGGNVGVVVSWDATNVSIRTGSGGISLLNNAGTALALTLTSWKYVVRCR